MTLIGLLVGILIVCVVIWAAKALLAAFNVGEPISTVVIVALVLICLVYLAGTVGYGPGLRLT
jgi:hypothetical protein